MKWCAIVLVRFHVVEVSSKREVRAVNHDVFEYVCVFAFGWNPRLGDVLNHSQRALTVGEDLYGPPNVGCDPVHTP